MTDDELRQLFEKQNSELRGYIDARTADLRVHFDTSLFRSTAETRVHFDSFAERIETKIDLLAEGLMHLDQKLDRTAADIRQEMREGFDDTHALIRFVHSQLDGRLRALE